MGNSMTSEDKAILGTIIFVAVLIISVWLGAFWKLYKIYSSPIKTIEMRESQK